MVSAGIKSPCINLAAIISVRLVVTEETRPQAVITSPPVRMIGLIERRSASIPKGRLLSAMPKITAEIVKEAVVSFTPNSACKTGRTGCGIYMVVNVAPTRQKTRACRPKDCPIFIADSFLFAWSI